MTHVALSRVAVFLSVVASVAPAAAASKQNKQAQERTARKACLDGNYSLGVSILSELFVDTKDPTYIFNQGRCLEQNRKYEDAIGRFEEYIRASEESSAGMAANDKAAAEKHLADCKERFAEQNGKPGGQAAPPATVLPAPSAVSEAASLPAPDTPRAVPIIATPEQPARAGAGWRTAGIITASFGGAAVLAGVLFNMKANSIINDMETTVGGYSSNKDSSHQTYETLAWVGYGVGAACLATGAVLFGIGLRDGTSSSGNLALAPALGTGYTGAVLTGGF